MTGEEYPTSPEKAILANVLQIAFYVFLIALIFGDQLFQQLGRPMPEFLKPMVESKLMYSIGSFFVFAQI